MSGGHGEHHEADPFAVVRKPHKRPTPEAEKSFQKDVVDPVAKQTVDDIRNLEQRSVYEVLLENQVAALRKKHEHKEEEKKEKKDEKSEEGKKDGDKSSTAKKDDHGKDHKDKEHGDKAHGDHHDTHGKHEHIGHKHARAPEIMGYVRRKLDERPEK